MKEIEIGIDGEKTARVEWMYPNIYKDESLDYIEIGLYHVRAADDIRIEFDGERNGYVIRMDRTVEREGHCETIEEKQEVAFIPAWNQE